MTQTDSSARVEPAIEALQAMIDGSSPDPYPVYARLREEAPVAWSPAMNAWIVSRHADVGRVFTDEEHFGPRFAEMSSSAIYGRTILHMTGAEHRRKSAILAKELRSPRLIRGDYKQMVLDIIDECAADFDDAPAVVDLKTTLTSIVPLAVIGQLMALMDATAFPDWYHLIVAASVSNVTGDPEIHARGVKAREDLFEFVTPKIDARRETPADDLLSTLVTTEFEGETLSDDEVRSFTAFLMSAGIETTDRAMVNLLVALMVNPDQWRRLKDDPSLAVSAIAEGLRYRAPVQGAVRDAVKEVELGGALIRPGERLFLALGSANHDPEAFDNPGRFDITRFTESSGGQFTQAAMLRSFGGGSHTCTGSLVAKVEMEEMLLHLLEHYDHLEFAREVPRDIGFYLRSPASLEVRMHPAVA